MYRENDKNTENTKHSKTTKTEQNVLDISSKTITVKLDKLPLFHLTLIHRIISL